MFSHHTWTRIMITVAAWSAGSAALTPRVVAQQVEIISGGRVKMSPDLSASERWPSIRVIERSGSGEIRDYAAVHPLTSAETLAVQRSLSDLGLDPGPHDGRFGPRVVQGLRSLQSARGLAVCGCLDGATLDALRLRPRVVDLAGRHDGVELLSGTGGASGRGGRPDGVEILAPPRRAAVVEPAAAEPSAAAEGDKAIPRGGAENPVYGIPLLGVGPLRPLRVPRSTQPGGRPLGAPAAGLRRGAPPGGGVSRGRMLPSGHPPRGRARGGRAPR